MMSFIDTLDFTYLALIAASLTALMTSYLGVLVVLRRIAFVGVALAQLATAGIALSGLLQIPCNLGAILLMLGGVSFFAQDHQRDLPSEGLIGSTYVAAGAMAVLFIALAPHTDSDMLGLLFGNILAVSSTDIIMMLVALAFIAAMNLLFFRQFLLISFDPLMAQSLGCKVSFWNWLFYLTVGTAIAVAIHSAGMLLVFSMLIVPPLTGLALSKHWNKVWIISTATSLAAVAVGIKISIQYDLPASPTIVACSCLLFLLALGWKRLREWAPQQ